MAASFCLSDRISVIGGSGSGKTLYIIKSHEPDIKKIYLYAKGLFEAKYQLPINKRGGSGINQFNNIFIEYSNDIQDIYKNMKDMIQIKNAKKLIGFDDIIADMLINKKSNPIVTELFIRGRKLNIIIQYQYFCT